MKNFSLLMVFLTITLCASAQGSNQAWKKYRHEVSVGYGLNTFLARIGANDEIGVRYVLQRSTFNASYRYYFAKHFAVRGSVTHGYSRKNDKIDDPTDNLADVDFEMTLTEFAVMGEYHIIDETTKGRKKGKVRRARGGMSKGVNLGMNLFAGLALDRFRPLGETQGSEVILKPYDAGAGFTSVKDYRKTNFHIPVGAQVRVIISPAWRVGLEGGYRFGFRDYIDNVSTVYYTNENPYASVSEYSDTQFTGYYTTIDKDDSKPIADLASKPGRRGYFFGLLSLSYRFKS